MKFPQFIERKLVKIEALFNYKVDDKGNRCGYIDEDEALKHGFNHTQWDTFMKRVKYYMNDFLKYGYCEAFPLTIIYCKETKENYIADGQGRIGGLKFGILLGKIFPFDAVPVQFFSVDTLDEVHHYIRLINTKKCVKMSTADICDISAKVFGGEVAEVRDEFNHYKNEVVKVKCDYNVGLMFFGCNYDKDSKNPDFRFDRSAFRPHKDTFCTQYAFFLEHIAETAIELGVASPHKINDKITGQNIAILFESFLNLILRVSIKYDGNNADKNMANATQLMVKYWNDKRCATRIETEFIRAIEIKKGDKDAFARHFNLHEIYTRVFTEFSDIYHDELEGFYCAWLVNSNEAVKKRKSVKRAA